MDVKDVEAKKRALEDLISTSIYDFEAETGCKVTNINLMGFRKLSYEPSPSIIVLDVGIH